MLCIPKINNNKVRCVVTMIMMMAQKSTEIPALNVFTALHKAAREPIHVKGDSAVVSIKHIFTF